MISLQRITVDVTKGVAKNALDLGALAGGRYPRFVTHDSADSVTGEVPVFNFHSVQPERFEAQLRHLATNRYRTLTADELLSVLERRMSAPERAVVLTFDDGRHSLWTVAYPLLRRYRLHAVAFVVPSWVEQRPPAATLDAVWSGALVAAELPLAPEGFCSWDELRQMQASGAVDIQSHSLHHARVAVSDRIVDFLAPQADPVAARYDLPVYRDGASDRWDRELHVGMPIFESAPRLSGRPRYLEDDRLRIACVTHVAERGGAAFFARRGAYRELFAVARRRQAELGQAGRFETDAEREEQLEQEIVRSKLWLEEQMPGHGVRHFCYPWWTGCDRTIAISRSVGYVSNFWGVLPGRRTNRPGDDPFGIVRLPDAYLLRLPGSGRQSLAAMMRERVRRGRAEVAQLMRHGAPA